MTTKHELLSEPLKVVDALKRGVAQTERDLKVLGLGNLAVEEAARLKYIKHHNLLCVAGMKVIFEPAAKGLRALNTVNSKAMPVYSVASPAPRSRVAEYAPYFPENSRPHRPGAEDAFNIKSRGV
jgi:hypothetical protein